MSDSNIDIFYQAASVWNELTEYNYLLTYGYKNKLYEINLTFSHEDFFHLAGFQYLKDIVLPRYNPEKTVSRILDGTIKLEQIQKAAQYEKKIVPRLEALVRMKYQLLNVKNFRYRMQFFRSNVYSKKRHDFQKVDCSGFCICHHLCCLS